MDKNVFLTSEGARQFTNALELLNTSIKEFNQIADKMIPENLLKEGLPAYLREFCRNLESEGGLKMEFVSNEENFRINEDVETDLFRSFRNILILYVRYSQPSIIRIKLNKSEHSVSMVVIDDGERNIFTNPDFVVSQELQNVKTIITEYQGTISINTLRKSGNEIEIQVPV